MSIRSYKKPRLKNLSPKTKTSLKIGESLALLGGWIPQISFLLVALPALAYFAGWKELSSYYSTLGAPWVTEALTTSMFLMTGAPKVTLFVIFLFLSIYYISVTENRGRHLGWASVVLIASCLICIVLRMSEIFSPEKTLKISQTESILLTLAASLSFAQAAILISNNKMKWSSKSSYVIYLGVYWGFILSPEHIGVANAQLHLLSDSDATPAAVVKVENRFEQWHLVGTIGSTAVLMSSVDNTKTARTFRVCELKDIAWIVTVKAK